MSRESLGPGAVPLVGAGTSGASPEPSPDPQFCRVIVVESDPSGVLTKDAGTVAVLNAAQGTETHAPGVWFNPEGGNTWHKLAPIVTATSPATLQLSPGTFAVDENGILWVYVDDTSTGAVDLSFLRTLYEHRERLADLWTYQPARDGTFDQNDDPYSPVTDGRSAQTLDGVTFPMRVGDRVVSLDGKLGFQRWAASAAQGGNRFFKPLHRMTVQNTTLGAIGEIISPDLYAWRTGPFKVTLRGHLAGSAGAFGLRMVINRDDLIHAGHFPTFKMHKSARLRYPATFAHPQVDGVYEGAVVSTLADTDAITEWCMLGCETAALHHTMGAGEGNPPAFFYLEMEFPAPWDGYNFMPVRWKLWTSSKYLNGVEQTNQIPIVLSEAESMIWINETGTTPFELRNIAFQTWAEIEGGFVPATEFGLDVQMEVSWP